MIKNKHLLSLSDMNQSENLLSLIEAGASSFKIEGRLKDIDYVKNVVSYYRNKLDEIIELSNGKYKKSSFGKVKQEFVPRLNRSFNRGYCNYFLLNRHLSNGEKIASIDTPKSLGEYIGTVRSCTGKELRLNTQTLISNGDGLSYFDKNGIYDGFRVNKVERNKLFISKVENLSIGTKIYRTYNKSFSDEINKDSAVSRRIEVCMSIREISNSILALDIADSRGNKITSCVQLPQKLEKAKNNQKLKQKECLSKLGGTIYELNEVEVLEDYFIPVSILSDLRRKAIEQLEQVQRIAYNYDYRKDENKKLRYPLAGLKYTDNVANKLSEDFYRSHEVTEIDRALEVCKNVDYSDKVLMHTRYCIRRELGCCNKTNSAQKLPQELFLKYGDSLKLKLVCDCLNCEMKIYKAD